MSAPGQAAGGDGGEGQTQGEAQGPDLNGMVDQIGQIASGQEEMRQFLASNPWQPQEQAEQEPEAQPDLDLSFLDPYGTQDPQAVQQTHEGLQGMVHQALEPYRKQMQQEVNSLREQQEEARREQQARDLAAEFPELQVKGAAEELAGENGLVKQWADELAQETGDPELAARLAAEPIIWRTVHLARAGGKHANELDGSDGPGAAPLESSGGPGPAQRSNEDIVQGIMDAGGQGSKVLNFRQ
jgi:hypothetical protein